VIDQQEGHSRCQPVNLAAEDAIELAEMLRFINYWLASDHDQLEASLRRYVGHPTYQLDRLTADLARFAFLLGDDPDGELFEPSVAP
jgi:hypothetical protein